MPPHGKPFPDQAARSRIFLIDDHSIMREGLRRLLEAESDLVVCGEAESSKQALNLLPNLQVNLVLIDIALPGTNGVDLIKSLRVQFPGLPMLVLSMHDEVLYAERSLRAGAKGYIMKSQTPVELVTAVRKVLKGEVYVSQALTSQLVQSLTVRRSRPPQGFEKLSDREMEIVELIGKGLSTAEIAQRLGISSKTVESHRGNIRSKLSLKSGPELVRFCMANTDGIVSTAES